MRERTTRLLERKTETERERERESLVHKRRDYPHSRSLDDDDDVTSTGVCTAALYDHLLEREYESPVIQDLVRECVRSHARARARTLSGESCTSCAKSRCDPGVFLDESETGKRDDGVRRIRTTACCLAKRP